MLVTLAVALLSAAPGHVSLLASDVPALPSAARVLAQADALTPPPLPPPEADSLEAESRDGRIADLSWQVYELNRRIQGLDTGWPGYSVALALVGVVVMAVPLSLLPFLVVSGEEFLPMGVVGLAGLGLFLGGYLSGTHASAPARRERDQLQDQRSQLRKELRRLLEQRGAVGQAAGTRPTFHVTLASLVF